MLYITLHFSLLVQSISGHGPRGGYCAWCRAQQSRLDSCVTPASRVRELYYPVSMLAFPFHLLDLIFALCPCFSFSFFSSGLSSCLCTFFLIQPPCLFPWSRRCRFQHGPCAGLVLRRPAGLASCGALSGIAALCLACVSVVVIVISYVLVRIFHLGSWGGPRSFRESAELQTPMDFTTFPALLFHCHSRRRL